MNRKPRTPPNRDPSSAPASLEAKAAAAVDPNPPEAPKGPPPKFQPPDPAAPPGARPLRAVDAVLHGAPGEVVDLGATKETKKNKGQLDQWRGENALSTVCSSIQGLVTASRAKFGHSAVMVGSEAESLVVGIPCPSLAFEYLTQQDGFLLGLVYQVVGAWGSFKSGFAYEVARWFARLNGGTVFCENETKFSPDWCASIMGYNSIDDCPLMLYRCDSVESWQERLQFGVNEVKRILTGTKENPGPGRSVPWLYAVDSVMGKVSRETSEKLREDGSAGRSFPLEALKINTFMKSLPQDIDGWPFAVLFVNHLKMRKDDRGNDVRGKAGGSAIDFQESFEIEMSGTGQRLVTADFTVKNVRMTCMKNSFGVDKRSIETRVLWWTEDVPQGNGKPPKLVQRTVWDWDWATVKLLTTVDDQSKARLKQADVHIDTPKVSPVENLAWSKSLGMASSDALPWHVVGRMIRQDPELTRRIRWALAIKERPRLAGDYLAQLEAQRKALA